MITEFKRNYFVKVSGSNVGLKINKSIGRKAYLLLFFIFLVFLKVSILAATPNCDGNACSVVNHWYSGTYPNGKHMFRNSSSGRVHIQLDGALGGASNLFDLNPGETKAAFVQVFAFPYHANFIGPVPKPGVHHPQQPAKHGAVISFTTGTGAVGGSIRIKPAGGVFTQKNLDKNSSQGSCASSLFFLANQVGLHAQIEGANSVRIYGRGFLVQTYGAAINMVNF